MTADEAEVDALLTKLIAGRSLDPAYARGYREGQHDAGRRAGREMGRRLRLKQREERIRAEKADHRLRARLCAEIGVSGALSWDEITRRLRTLHRERFHFEALARDAGKC